MVAMSAAAAALFSLNSAAIVDVPLRFVSLKAPGAEGRQGPGPEHPVRWIYEHARLPLQVIGENGGWVHVRDPDGAEVWMASGAIEERRTVYVRGETALRRAPRPGAQTTAHLALGVIASITGCAGDWRRIAVGGRIGWVENSAVWGGDCGGLDAAIRP
jgi:SH3-like domain-containing protein